MKMLIKSAAVCAVLVAGAAVARAYDSLEELMTDLQKQQTVALREYIDKHPDAADIGDAEDRLSYSLVLAGEYDEAASLLLKKYDAAVKAGKEDMGQLFGMTIVPIVQTYIQGGRIAEGRAFLGRVRKDLGDRAQDPEISSALGQLEQGLKLPSVGETVDVKFKATDGTDIDVSKMTNEVVLVDFWASWCMPCMQDLPHVKALYEEFHARGFEIVGISLDEEREALDKVVKEKNITWPQSYDGEAWETPLATKYGVQSIPTTFLIGKDGKIAGVNLRSDALRKKVTELLPAAEAKK